MSWPEKTTAADPAKANGWMRGEWREGLRRMQPGLGDRFVRRLDPVDTGSHMKRVVRRVRTGA